MRASIILLPCLAFAAAALTAIPDAAACGGCFTPQMQSQSTQVTGHRMIQSISPTQSTLWDQFQYAGDPASFAWVLPIKGLATVGLSSDALFGYLEQVTPVTIVSPPLNCPGPPFCENGVVAASASSGSFASSGTGDPPVTVIAEEVVGPYETAQLMSQDPAELSNWLTSRGYAIPPDIVPILGAYINDGFGFLAMKLVPGQGVDSMRPVRVSTPGANPTLPLRMVAAGTGAYTPITLWVFGEGRYEPSSFPWFTIAETELVWDWDTQSSNYALLKDAGMKANNGRSWLVDVAEPFGWADLEYALVQAATSSPIESGYADEMGQGAVDAANADIEDLFWDINKSNLWMTRMQANLPRAALSIDLTIAASVDQSPVQRQFTAPAETGTKPCTQWPPCPDTSSSTGSGGGSGTGAGAGGAGDVGVEGGCAVSPASSGAAATGTLALAIALAFARRRRGQR